MKIKVTLLTLMLAMFTSFAFANNSTELNNDNISTEIAADLDFEVSTVSISYEEEACTVTVTVSILGQGGTISATADTCAQAVAEVKKGIDALL